MGVGNGGRVKTLPYKGCGGFGGVGRAVPGPYGGWVSAGGLDTRPYGIGFGGRFDKARQNDSASLFDCTQVFGVESAVS